MIASKTGPHWDAMGGMMILVLRRDTEIAFCPWSARLLSYLGLTGKELGRDIAKLTNWEQPNIQMTTI